MTPGPTAGGAPPLLVVISGPSGVGKDAVMARAMERDARLVRSLTMTTRPPRPGERDEVDYDFVSAEEFARQLEAGELLEHAEVHGNRYGTPRRRVREALASGRDVLLQIDVQGSLALREVAPGALFVYVAPEHASVLESRIRERGADEATLASRRADRERELAARDRFEHVLVNREGDLEATTAALLGLIEEERTRAERAPVEV